MHALFAAATTLGAFLLFLVQPLLGRFVLPWFGGGSTVWTVCMLFFQAGLLAGYLYAHLLVLRLPARRGVVLHAALLALSLLTLPLTPEAPAPETPPTVGILLVLFLSVGVPYAILSATAPLVQAWAARVERAREPYRLYAWSNAGSLVALLAYPLLVEPALGLSAQAATWSVAYAAFALLLAACGVATWRRAGTTVAPVDAEPVGPPPSRADRVLWVALSACGSTLLLATTDRMSEDISATPFLWVVPLALYLLSFIICFGRPRLASPVFWIPALVIALFGQTMALHRGAVLGLPWQLALHAGGLFAGCMVLHGDLVRHRPPPGWLTGFYLATATGGAIGGLLVGVGAPRLLPLRVELHVAMVLTAALPLSIAWRARRRVAMRGEPRWVWLLPAMAVAFLAWGLYRHAATSYAGSRWMARGFHGVLKVKHTPARAPEGPSLRLLHGRIMHGRQYTDARRRDPTSYYGPRSGLGLLFRWGQDLPPRHIGAIGLGVGTVAAFGRCGDSITFYEIDPLVLRAARTWFSFLSETCAEVDTVLGDARLTLSRTDAVYDVLVLDAFSGDAIPAHLLTREAMELYDARLARDGVLAINVSNRHLDLRPIVRAHAAHLGMELSEITSEGEPKRALNRARWILLTRRPELRSWVTKEGELDLVDASVRQTWTDDHAPLLPILRAFQRR